MIEHAPRILALDPGKTTGTAYHDTETGDVEFRQLNFDDTCQYAGTLTAKHGESLLIVAESFIITANTAKNSQAPWSLELIGVARFFSRFYCGRDLRLQSPASAKRFSSDERLRMLGWYNKGMGHANDAARHLLLLEATRGYLTTEQLQQFALQA